MMPKNDTAAAVVKEAISITQIRVFSTFTPKLLAVSSPVFSERIFHLFRIKNKSDGRVIAVKI